MEGSGPGGRSVGGYLEVLTTHGGWVRRVLTGRLAGLGRLLPRTGQERGEGRGGAEEVVVQHRLLRADCD